MSCEFCSKVAFTNEISGKQFFIPMKDMFGGCRGDICVAINDRGEYVLHYEDDKDVESDMVDVKIAFCPMCGRKLAMDISIDWMKMIRDVLDEKIKELEG